MLAVLRQRNYALLWSAGVLSYTGDWVLLIALPYYVYELTGSALATGAMFMAYNVPRVLFTSLAGVFADRWDRKWTMVVADVSRAVLLLLLLTMQSVESLWIVYLVTFAQAAIGQFFFPARSALIPRLVGEQHLMAANSLDTLSGGLTRLIGPPIGGVLMALLGLSSAVLVDSASFLASAVLIALISLPSEPIRERASSDHRPTVAIWTSVWRDWLEGIQLVRRERVVAAVFAGAGLTMIGYGMITVLLVVYAREVLGGGPVTYGWLATAQGVGTLIGGLAIGQLERSLPPARLLPLSLGAAGLTFLLTFNVPVLLLVLAFIGFAGASLAGSMVGEQTLLQSSVTDRYRGRVFGVYGSINSLLILVGMGLASGLGEPLGTVPTLNVASSVYVLASVVVLLMLSRAKASSRPRAEPVPHG